MTVFFKHDILSSIATKRFGLNQENKRFVGTSSTNNVADSTECVAWSGSRGWAQNYCYKLTLATGVDYDSVYKSGVKSCPSSDNGFEIPCYLKLNDTLLLSTGNIRSKKMFTFPRCSGTGKVWAAGISNTADCKSKCSTIAECKGFTFRAGLSHKSCALHYGEVAVRGAEAAAVSGLLECPAV